uniref:Apoptosis regulator Bcl-2-like n=1 Tax=Phallusia mammillata TaxID=59560 RepID=A0A6F9DJR1_9ASCI|nr:apoptosis regulator Bcl-2-like [Phallusia mammillata]
MVHKTRRIVERYIFNKVKSLLNNTPQQFESHLSIIYQSDNNPSPVHLAVQRAAENYEIRYKEAFPDLMDQMRTTNTTTEDIEGLFTKISTELFQLHKKESDTTNVNGELIKWGHVMALFVFAGVLATRAVELNSLHQVDSIISWVTDFLDQDLSSWLKRQGGWENFIEWAEKLDNSNQEDIQNLPPNFGQGMRSLMGVGVLAACVGLGAVFLIHK